MICPEKGNKTDKPRASIGVKLRRLLVVIIISHAGAREENVDEIIFNGSRRSWRLIIK